MRRGCEWAGGQAGILGLAEARSARKVGVQGPSSCPCAACASSPVQPSGPQSVGRTLTLLFLLVLSPSGLACSSPDEGDGIGPGAGLGDAGKCTTPAFLPRGPGLQLGLGLEAPCPPRGCSHFPSPAGD